MISFISAAQMARQFAKPTAWNTVLADGRTKLESHCADELGLTVRAKVEVARMGIFEGKRCHQIMVCNYPREAEFEQMVRSVGGEVEFASAPNGRWAKAHLPL